MRNTKLKSIDLSVSKGADRKNEGGMKNSPFKTLQRNDSDKDNVKVYVVKLI